MLILTAALQAWNTTSFAATLKAELEALAASDLPLHQGVSQAGMVDAAPITVTVFSSEETEQSLATRVGVFFTEIVINCGCGDDPMPINAYCELLIGIDKLTAEATVTVVTD